MQGDATAYYYYLDLDGDRLPGGNYGHICVAAGEEDNQAIINNGQTVGLVTCGSGGVSNGTCANAARDIDDDCNGCGTTVACPDNTLEDLYDACGLCNGVIDSTQCVSQYPNLSCYDIEVFEGVADTLAFMDCGGTCYYGNPNGNVGSGFVTLYKDLDNDGWGSSIDSIQTCSATFFDTTYTSNNLDYNDSVNCIRNTIKCNACVSEKIDSCDICDGYDLVDPDGNCAFTIYPGDVDNNGKVDVGDIAPIVHYWTTVVYPYRSWTTNLDGKTITSTYDFEIPAYHYNSAVKNSDKCLLRADANGDGIVNILDVFAVYVNLGKTHTYPLDLGYCNDLSSSELDRSIYYEIYSSLPDGELKRSIGKDFNFEYLPSIISVSQSYPNPFNVSTSIRYSIPDKGDLTFQVVNILGQIMETKSLQVDPGNYNYIWDASLFPSGIYFSQIYFNNKLVNTQKMVLIK